MAPEEKKDNVVMAATPNTVPTIPDDWAAFGAETGYNPRPPEDLRLCIMGPSGEGKTTFLSGIEKHLILDAEHGADAIVGTKSIRLHIPNYEKFDDTITKLITDAKAGKKYFHRVTLDHVGDFVDIVAKKLSIEKNTEDIASYGSQGSGYRLIRDRLFSKLRDLEDHGYVWSAVFHVVTRTEPSPIDRKDRTVIREDVYPSIVQKFANKSDFRMMIYCLPETVEKKKDQILPGGRKIQVPAGTEVQKKYYVDVRSAESKNTKTRGVPVFDDRFTIPLVGGWDEFQRRYNEAIDAMKKQYGS